MAQVAQGTFQVEMKPTTDPDAQDGVSIGHLSLVKTFAGDLVATSRGQMLTALTPTEGSAGYVAIERVTGALHGREGSFVLQHAGMMDRGAQHLSILVVPDSGTGALAGMVGTFQLTVEGGRHHYELAYTLP